MDRKCPTCGAEVQSNAPFGQCPKCLLELGFGSPGGEAQGPAVQSERRLVGDYELIEQTGRGGMGVVYKARQISLNRIVALKMIVAGGFASPSAVHRFQIEAEAAARLDHPNIVPIYEIGVEEGLHYFSMRWVEGPSLQELIRSGKFQNGEQSGTGRDSYLKIVRLIAKLARSVDYAHLQGVLHRDLKPSNILLDEKGEPHLTDFGLAKILEHEVGMTRTAEVMGSPNYMSPEQASGGKSDKAGDIYSLGAILFELLTGRPPFLAPSVTETLKLLTEEDPPDPRTLNRTLNRDLSTIVLKCLEKAPGRRYRSASELADDLERWERNEPILARRTNVVELSRRWIARNRMAAALILTLTGGLATTSFLLRQSKAQESAKQSALSVLKRSISAYIYQIGKPPVRVLQISSKQLRVLSANEAVSDETLASKHYIVGVFVSANPMETILGYARMFASLERSLATSLGTPVRLDLNLYLDYDQAREDFIKGQVAFGRIDPRLYLEAEAKTNVTLLATEEAKTYPGLIFARADSGITNLSGLKGRSLLLWDEDSMVSLFAKKVLREHGLCSSTVHSSVVFRQAERLRLGYMEAPPEGYFDHECQTVRQVLKDRSQDAGVALGRNFRRYPAESWRALARFEVPRSVWAASPALGEEERKIVQRALVDWEPGREDGKYGHGFEVKLAGAKPGSLESIRAVLAQASSFDHCDLPQAAASGGERFARKSRDSQ